MEKEKIVLGNEMETPSWSLRKEILNFDEALTAYDHMSMRIMGSVLLIFFQIK